MAQINVDGQVWTNVVEWPNDEGWHHWQTELTSRTELSVYGHVIRDMDNLGYGTGEFQGKQYIYNPSDKTTTKIAHGYMDANTLAEAMKELTARVKKPVKAIALSVAEPNTKEQA